MPCQFPQESLPTFALESPCTTRCSSSVSDQWHSVAGHRIPLFSCRHILALRLALVLLWCWKGLPSGGWRWACWRLNDIPWQCSLCPCEQEIQRHVHVYPLFHWRKPCVLPLLLLRQSFFHLISQSPRILHLYLSILRVSSWSFPAALSVPVLHLHVHGSNLLLRQTLQTFTPVS